MPLVLAFLLLACGGALREYVREVLPCGGHMVLFVGRVSSLTMIAQKSKSLALLHAIANDPPDSIVTACIPEDDVDREPNP